jgi:hypothetical protein
MLGRGHGSAFLRLLAGKLIREGAPLVAIDPIADNFRARRARETFHLPARPITVMNRRDGARKRRIRVTLTGILLFSV